MNLTSSIPSISPIGNATPRVPHRTRLGYSATYERPAVRSFQTWELDYGIDHTRAIVESIAVALFALRLVPANRRKVYRDRRRPRVLMARFSQAQSRLRRLWAERCRRDGVGYDDGD